MPTPSDDGPLLSPPAEHDGHSGGRTTCPPEETRQSPSRSESEREPLLEGASADNSFSPPAQQPTPPAEGDASSDATTIPDVHSKRQETEEDGPIRDIPSPLSAVEETADCDQRNAQNGTISAAASSASAPWYHPGLFPSPFSNARFLPNSTSSFLRPGSKFHGNQQSDRQVYDVQVEIKHVDMKESFLCGYLRIQGLTEDHPSLTTYFEGEIIGSKYTFTTKHPEWGSNEKVDMQHWARFQAWRPLAKQAKRQDFTYKNFAQREHIFMRWKEYFLVPDHRVRTINGASFEGFYYICFNQVSGSISGIYFHAKSEKFQQLELKHVPDFGCQGAIEFR
ncbi:uncharacterized protein BDZ99DRAFT_451283 [Mytilinidion resinicola]|uniref:Vesicle-mediated transport protein Vid24 n=1 Tax=Mytilinidion resinicola TaxID=574789 RepID=A0A6A6YAH2_9PEZI|nr:uncharacterized protein BDZ99DRAFT_451283 [Mytilinidion resinicola]KAF2804827.1 hypothetical protein BDZ99DRAFT_451283 [Mytilinidion resinicola]